MKAPVWLFFQIILINSQIYLITKYEKRPYAMRKRIKRYMHLAVLQIVVFKDLKPPIVKYII